MLRRFRQRATVAVDTRMYRAEVIKQFRLAEPTIMPADELIRDFVRAQRWVEDIYADQLSAEVPPECLVGWLRFGQPTEDGKRLYLDPVRVESVWRFGLVEGELRWTAWGDHSTYTERIHPPSPPEEEFRV